MSEYENSTTIACARCGQDWLRRWLVPQTDEVVLMCDECLAVWLEGTTVNNLTYQQIWTFMQSRGLDERANDLVSIGA